MTGKYPFNIGMQHEVILSDQPWCLGLNESIFPQYFKAVGYKTHLVGKWHLGFHMKECTPTYRGFDSHFGYLGPHVDYYDHSILWVDYKLAKPYERALDFRTNLRINDTFKGQYMTEILTDEAVDIIKRHDGKDSLLLMLNHLAPHSGNEDNPVQAPKEIVDKFRHIKDLNRRTYAGKLSLISVVKTFLNLFL